jgi:hypothetical protein
MTEMPVTCRVRLTRRATQRRASGPAFVLASPRGVYNKPTAETHVLIKSIRGFSRSYVPQQTQPEGGPQEGASAGPGSVANMYTLPFDVAIPALLGCSLGAMLLWREHRGGVYAGVMAPSGGVMPVGSIRQAYTEINKGGKTSPSRGCSLGALMLLGVPSGPAVLWDATTSRNAAPLIQSPSLLYRPEAIASAPTGCRAPLHTPAEGRWWASVCTQANVLIVGVVGWLCV